MAPFIRGESRLSINFTGIAAAHMVTLCPVSICTIIGLRLKMSPERNSGALAGLGRDCGAPPLMLAAKSLVAI